MSFKMTNTIFTFDTENFNEILKKALANDQVIIRDGVAYWKKGLPNSGIIQHLPLKPVDITSSQDLINVMGSVQSTLQSTVVIAQTISTATLMVAIAVQTQILSKKIEQVQKSILSVSKEIQEQNLIFYTDKASEYLGLLHSFKLILSSPTHLNEIKELANNTLAKSIQIKGQLVSFINNAFHLINGNEIKNHRHIEIILNFIQQMMEVLPLGMHLEFILSHRLEQHNFSQTLIEDSHQQYSLLEEKYRSYLNKISTDLRELKITSQDVPYFERLKTPAKSLLQSSMSLELLTKPASEKIAYLN